MKKYFPAVAAVTLLFLMVTGCSKRAEITSDTSWCWRNSDGLIVNGAGNETMPLSSGDTCYFRKTGGTGFIKVEIKSSNPFSAPETYETTAHDIITVCAN